jgi:hypothetical protein
MNVRAFNDKTFKNVAQQKIKNEKKNTLTYLLQFIMIDYILISRA